jgi:hypothetical protein
MVTYQVVISKATMMSSFRIRAVNEIATILRNSFSNSSKDMIIMAPPVPNMSTNGTTGHAVPGETHLGRH